MRPVGARDSSHLIRASEGSRGWGGGGRHGEVTDGNNKEDRKAIESSGQSRRAGSSGWRCCDYSCSVKCSCQQERSVWRKTAAGISLVARHFTSVHCPRDITPDDLLQDQNRGSGAEFKCLHLRFGLDF